MSKIRGSSQLQEGSVDDAHLAPESMLDVLRLTQSPGGFTLSRDSEGSVVSAVMPLSNGDIKLVEFTRDSSGQVTSVTISFTISTYTKTYNVNRDPNGNVIFVDEV
jgi:hypothetical protein